MKSFYTSILLLLLLVITKQPYCQNIDSLQHLFQTSQIDSTKINAGYEIAYHLRIKNPTQGLRIIDEVIEVLISSSNISQKIELEKYKYYLLKAIIYNNLDQFDKSEKHFLIAIKEANKTKKDYAIIESKMNYASLLTNKKDTRSKGILRDIINTIDTTASYKNRRILFITKYNLGKVLSHESQLDSAIHLFTTLLNFGDQKIVKDSDYAVFNSIAVALKKSKNYKEAIKYYKEALNTPSCPESFAGLICANISNLYLEQNSLDSSEVYATHILDFKSQTSKTLFRANKLISDINFKRNNIKLAQTFLNEAKQHKANLENVELEIDILFAECRIALAKREYSKTEGLLTKMQEHLVNNKDVWTNFTKSELAFLRLSFITKQNSKSDFDLLEHYVKLRDTIEIEKTNSSIQDAITKFQTEKKETENTLLKKEKELQKSTIQQQQFKLLSTIGGISLLSIISFLLYRQNKESKRINTKLTKKNEQIDTLHQELAHRVKNNLFFISTLMKMQGKQLMSKEAIQAVKEGETRLEAMSLLHRKLHLGQNEKEINLEEYLQELCANLQNTFPYSGRQPLINLESENISFDGDTAIKIGLVVNELVTNSFKYAFENCNNPQINIDVTKLNDHTCQLIYKDNGVGLPNSLNFNDNESMGLKLIKSLVTQLNGSIETSNQNGAWIKIDFQNPNLI